MVKKLYPTPHVVHWFHTRPVCRPQHRNQPPVRQDAGIKTRCHKAFGDIHKPLQKLAVVSRLLQEPLHGNCIPHHCNIGMRHNIRELAHSVPSHVGSAVGPRITQSLQLSGHCRAPLRKDEFCEQQMRSEVAVKGKQPTPSLRFPHLPPITRQSRTRLPAKPQPVPCRV